MYRSQFHYPFFMVVKQNLPVFLASISTSSHVSLAVEPRHIPLAWPFHALIVLCVFRFVIVLIPCDKKTEIAVKTRCQSDKVQLATHRTV